MRSCVRLGRAHGNRCLGPIQMAKVTQLPCPLFFAVSPVALLLRVC